VHVAQSKFYTGETMESLKQALLNAIDNSAPANAVIGGTKAGQPMPANTVDSNARSPKAPSNKKGKTVEPALIGADNYAAYLNPRQCALLAEFCDEFTTYTLEHGYFVDRAREIVAAIFPKPCAFGTWKPVMRGVSEDMGVSARKAFARAYKELHGSLPTADYKYKKGTGVKGGSPKKAARSSSRPLARGTRPRCSCSTPRAS
jgi:hypothetical protein